MSARWPIQAFRIASLVVPSALAWNVAFTAAQPTDLTRAVMYALGPMWITMAGALAIRSLDALLRRGRASDATLLDRLDVLTASGCSMAWLGAGGIMASVWVGWASLSMVGLLGLGLLHLVVLWTLVRTGSEDPWRRASLTRHLGPATAVEGDRVIESITLSSVRIPTGFRLLASGRVGPRWPTSRYAVEASESHGELVLESDLGPAIRGEHRAEPLAVWLQDVFGLCHSIRIRAGDARLTVLPKPRDVTGAEHLRGPGGERTEARPERRLPTEGSFRLREYQAGDDARRIHWARSLSAGEIVVRMPDEIPPDQPCARLVLDTFLPGAAELSCAATGELLDALVGVWLSVGRALTDDGVRVMLVTAAPRPDGEDPRAIAFHQRLTPRAFAEAQRLGARVRWQSDLPLEPLVAEAKEPSIVISARPRPASIPDVRWIIVPEPSWTIPVEIPRRSAALVPHPFGSPDNRRLRLRRERKRQEMARRDHAVLAELCARHAADLHDLHEAGNLVARRAPRSAIRLEALR